MDLCCQQKCHPSQPKNHFIVTVCNLSHRLLCNDIQSSLKYHLVHSKHPLITTISIDSRSHFYQALRENKFITLFSQKNFNTLEKDERQDYQALTFRDHLSFTVALVTCRQKSFEGCDRLFIEALKNHF